MKKKQNANIKCDVNSCKYNDCDNENCTLDEIKVSNCNCDDAKQKDATMCSSFECDHEKEAE